MEESRSTLCGVMLIILEIVAYCSPCTRAASSTKLLNKIKNLTDFIVGASDNVAKVPSHLLVCDPSHPETNLYHSI